MEETTNPYKGWEKYLCQDCKDMLTKEMTPVYENINSGSTIKRTKAKMQIAKLQVTLYKKFCPKCLNKLQNKLRQEGKI